MAITATDSWGTKASRPSSLSIEVAGRSSKLRAGTVVTVIATDYFHYNRSQQVTVQGTVAPAAPHVNTVTHTSTKIIGTTVANATITVTINDTTSLTGQADKYGHFSIPIGPHVKGTTLLVTATDIWGNTSKATTITVR